MKTPDLDTDKPALIPELIAEQVTPDSAMQARLCERARRHWKPPQDSANHSHGRTNVLFSVCGLTIGLQARALPDARLTPRNS